MKSKLIFSLFVLLTSVSIYAVEVANTPTYTVAELTFTGPSQTQNSSTLDFWVTFTHESGSPSYKVYGFYDGDGAGGNSGNVFKVRFCPTVAGKWNITDTYSTDAALNNQKEGDFVTATASTNHGFWEVEKSYGGGRWYKRSDGSHQFIVGNTMYDMLKFRDRAGIISDVNGNGDYYKKLRFMIDGSEGYLGAPPDGTYPNVGFYNAKADYAITTALAKDLIADLILYKSLYLNNGESYVKYIAARYGSYPNVWFCLANEWDIKTPLTSTQAKDMGQQLRKYIPYGNPLSIHPNSGTGWNTALNTTPPWNDHKIAQKKTKAMDAAADNTITNYDRIPVGMPSFNDENGYEGAGDGYTGDDVVEGIIGTFAGGGCGSTAYKPAKAEGQYTKGNFNANEHTASIKLLWMKNAIDANIEFWKLEPVALSSSIFTGTNTYYRALQEPGQQYVLVTKNAKTMTANLPAGTWTLKQIDIIAKTITTTNNLTGTINFSSPASRACINYFKLADNTPSPAILSPLSGVNFAPGKAYTATGSGANLSWSVSVVSGSVIATGTGSGINFTVPVNTANNAQIKVQLTGGTNSNEVVSQNYTVVDDVPSINAITENFTKNTPINYQLTATGNGTPFTWTATSIPSELTLSASGLLQGTIANVGTVSLSVKATDLDGDFDSKTLSFDILDALPPFCETAGQIVIEAENFHTKNFNGDLIEWELGNSYAGYAGTGYVETVDNDATNAAAWTEAADLTYKINFSTTGAYVIWLYRYGPDGDSNSVKIGLDEVEFISSFDNGGTGSWGWAKNATTLNVTNAGLHTLNIRRREDGYAFDKIILTTNSAYIPSGNAQPQSQCLTTENATTTENNVVVLYQPSLHKIKVQTIHQKGKIIVTTIDGKLILNLPIKNATEEINTTALAAGVYLLAIVNNGIATQKTICVQ